MESTEEFFSSGGGLGAWGGLAVLGRRDSGMDGGGRFAELRGTGLFGARCWCFCVAKPARSSRTDGGKMRDRTLSSGIVMSCVVDGPIWFKKVDWLMFNASFFFHL